MVDQLLGYGDCSLLLLYSIVATAWQTVLLPGSVILSSSCLWHPEGPCPPRACSYLKRLYPGDDAEQQAAAASMEKMKESPQPR